MSRQVNFLQTINIAHLIPGIYIVELLSGNTKAAKKLIVY
ncbi:MAG: T9SS type A sorting domain-containing protein [Bacteroidetes bacterium]|nr:T9SS type A sorting domain-containing protein [Bacteroidota bacterium]